MVAPERNDRVLGNGGVLHRIQQPADHVVHVRHRGQVGLDEGPPVPGSDDLVELVGLDELLGKVGNVVQVAGRILRQDDAVEGIEVEILLRHDPRRVRRREPDRQEQPGIAGRHLVGLQEGLDRRDVDLVMQLGRVADELGGVDRGGRLDQVRRVIQQRAVFFAAQQMVVQQVRVAGIPQGMQHLAAERGVVAGQLHLRRHRPRRVDIVESIHGIVEDAGRLRAHARHHGRARAVALRHRGIGAGEGHAHRRQAVQVWRMHWQGIVAQHRCPAIQIVRHDHHDIGHG